MTKFEEAMINVSRATDGRGLHVTLHHGPSTAQALRESTYAFMQQFDPDAFFINGLDSNASTDAAEAAAWTNLALLALATAAAIRED